MLKLHLIFYFEFFMRNYGYQYTCMPITRSADQI